MNHLPSPGISCPEPSAALSGGPNFSPSQGAIDQAITRRRFLKRTGGATAASFIAWHLTSKSLQAEPVDYPTGFSMGEPDEEDPRYAIYTASPSKTDADRDEQTEVRTRLLEGKLSTIDNKIYEGKLWYRISPESPDGMDSCTPAWEVMHAIVGVEIWEKNTPNTKVVSYGVNTSTPLASRVTADVEVPDQSMPKGTAVCTKRKWDTTTNDYLNYRSEITLEMELNAAPDQAEEFGGCYRIGSDFVLEGTDGPISGLEWREKFSSVHCIKACEDEED